jgi:cysteine desulfurase
MKKTVYADNAATTALSKTALEAMLPFLTEQYGNPSSIYKYGRGQQESG